LRIVIADYSGHPFQVQLSRELARRGHSVLHLHFAEFQTPKGRLTLGPDDPETLSIEAISIGKKFAKHSFIKRRSQEIDVGKRFARRIAEFQPDVVVGSNLPLDSLRVVSGCCRASNLAFVFWQQDIYSVAITRILTAKYGPIGAWLGRRYKAIEKRILLSSNAIVIISEDFLPFLQESFDISENKIYVIHNWAPLDEIIPCEKNNAWARANGLEGKDVVLYSGTLGMKHDPAQILAVAQELRDEPNIILVVVSEGPGALWLKKKATDHDLPALRVLNFQPFDVYSEVLASAEILLAILEADAGAFSVPSKVLSYLCAQRAIVLSAPASNLAVRLVNDAKAGLVSPAGDHHRLAANVRSLLKDNKSRLDAGMRGRAYAEGAFDITRIGDLFSVVLSDALNDSTRSSSKDNLLLHEGKSAVSVSSCIRRLINKSTT